jgi:glycosyltransferase involved in cell wall biosynthesis
VRVLLLSAYAAQSHRHWRDMLLHMCPEWQWQVLELPPRHFSWRVRGNPLWWAQQERATLEAQYDLVVATSMVDLATLRGLVPALAQCPSALYFHENQFAYPAQGRQSSVLEAQMVSLYSALAADALWFNSAWNRDSFLTGVDKLLKKLPDHVPPDVASRLRARAVVLPVPLGEPETAAGDACWQRGDSNPKIVWLGRFEYDKGPEQLAAVLAELEARLPDYSLALVGQQFRQSPPEFDALAEQFNHRLAHCGYIARRADYLETLAQADIVLSTALHEFQGLALQEAVAQGAYPVVPDRLAYCEIYPHECRYRSVPDQPPVEARGAVDTLLAALADTRSAPSMSAFSCDQLAPRYRREVQRLLSSDSH